MFFFICLYDPAGGFCVEVVEDELFGATQALRRPSVMSGIVLPPGGGRDPAGLSNRRDRTQLLLYRSERNSSKTH